MAMINVNVQPEIIKWALSQTDKEKLGEKLVNYINQWLEGTKTPTFKQIEEFSKKSNIPLGYFFLMKPPTEQLNILEYRTIDSVEFINPSRNLIDTIHDMENIQGWMRDYRQDMGFGELSVVGCLSGSTNVKIIVDTIRADIGLKNDWYTNCDNIATAFHHIRGLLEECGIVVMMNGVVGNNTHRVLDVNEFRAFAMIDKWAPLIFINSADSWGAKLFSLFHEIAHIWLGLDDFYNDRRNNKEIKPIETICNAVAGELMVPMDAFITNWNEIIAENVYDKIKDMTKIFRCGESVIARKALDSGKITKTIYDEIIENVIEAYRQMKEDKESSGGNYYYTMGTRLDACFIRALCESIQIGRTTYTEAYRLTNTNRRTFEKIAVRLGGVE